MYARLRSVIAYDVKKEIPCTQILNQKPCRGSSSAIAMIPISTSEEFVALLIAFVKTGFKWLSTRTRIHLAKVGQSGWTDS